jgi:polyhydroxybutyrate depolymerase
MRRLIAWSFAFVACDPGPSSTANWPGGAKSPEATATSTATAASPSCGKAAPKGVLAKKVTVFGKSRSYTLVVPAAYNASVSQPLIYVLHGHGGTGAQARATLDLEGASGGKGIFVYPDSLSGGWDLDSETGKNRDVAFFDAMLAQVQSDYCVDLHRVFIAGFSNGAYMANQLACRRGERVRAVATHSGGGPYDSSASAKYDDHGQLECSGKPVAALVFHGTADGTVAPSEGQKSIDHWVAANHCSSPAPSGLCAVYAGCTNPVIACKVQGLGHTVWGEAAKRAWTFFDAQR